MFEDYYRDGTGMFFLAWYTSQINTLLNDPPPQFKGLFTGSSQNNHSV